MKRWLAIGLTMATAGVARAEDEFFLRFVSTTGSLVTEVRPNGEAVFSNAADSVSGRFQRATDLAVSNWMDYVQYAESGATATQRLFDPNPPEGMAYVPGGIFQMGDTFGEGGWNTPVHTLYVSEFYMDKTEVTQGQWDEVFGWALTNGYAFDNAGSRYSGRNYSKGTDHPVFYINWFDSVKWCNARSEREGRPPVYSTNGAPYRKGTNSDVVCNWMAAGYRLPTEAEWEKAARGGARARRFPWADADTIDRSRANYNCFQNNGTNTYAYDLAPTEGWDPAYTNGGTPYTAPAGSYAPNGYGLYDMAGNLWEFCWDWHGDGWYGDPGAVEADSHGPAFGEYRVSRGGGWFFFAESFRVAKRGGDEPSTPSFFTGFRTVRVPERQ